MFILKLLLFVGCSMSLAMNKEALQELKKENPFPYDLGIKIIPSKSKKAGVMICCHGYGHCNEIADVVHSFKTVHDHIIGFNFPDYGITPEIDHTKSSFGTIDELLPLLYILKRCVIDLHISTINLYGFSAGGGALVNALVVLNQTNYDKQLETIGISVDAKKDILHALERGLIILDCPLKSVEEVIALRGPSPEFNALAPHYVKNNMRPLDAVQALKGLKLNILLHFQNPDEILGNRDDALFIERLRTANRGKTTVVIGHEGGHNSYHASLWKQYKKIS